ncbi:MAG: DinB family protein [Chloroflexi bacterium]|nr:DinB family protein [Chloroflexota bacterium]
MSDRKRDIIAHIEGARGDLVDLAQSLDAESLARPTCNEGWCVKDVLAHLAGSEAGLKRLANLAAKGESAVRPGFDLHEYNKEQVNLRRDRTIPDLLAELATSRTATLAFLETLPEDALDKLGSLSTGLEQTTEQILRRIGDHDRLHAEEIQKAIAE